MKRLIGYIFLASIFILILLAGCSPQSNGPSNPLYKIDIPAVAGKVPPVSFDLTAPLGEFPEKIQVYRMIKPEVNAEYVKAIGAKLGFQGEISFGSDNRFHMGNENIQLEVLPPTGSIIYNKLKPAVLFPKEIYEARQKPELPSFEEAAAIAADFLSQRGLLPEGVKVNKVIVGGKAGSVPDHLAVSFDYRIDGFRFTGSGASYNVRIGHEGQIGQIMINPVKWAPHEMVSIKPVEQAFRELKAESKYSAPYNTKKVKVDNVSIEYWLEGMDIDQEFIVPVYTFQGQCLDASGKVLESLFKASVEAVK